MAFVESYIDDPDTRLTFYMSHLCRLCANPSETHGLHVPERVHFMLHRKKPTANVPHFFSIHEGRNVVMFIKNMGLPSSRPVIRMYVYLTLKNHARAFLDSQRSVPPYFLRQFLQQSNLCPSPPGLTSQKFSKK